MSDVNFQLGDLRFQWSREKAQINKRKHKVSFEVAANVFFDEDRIERLDTFHSDDEDRWQVIGKVEDILFVVYTENFDSTRIISARKATSRERRDYYDRTENY